MSGTSTFFHAALLQEGGDTPHDKGKEPFSTSKTSNWVARAGGLPTYIQHVAHAMVEKGKDESKAIQMAVGIVKNWSEGKGNVSTAVKAAATKAMAEWEAKKAGTKAKKVAESYELLQEHAVLFGPEHLMEVLEGKHRATELERVGEEMLVEVARWMLPVAAKQPGFRPTNPEKKSTSTNSEFNNKHPRGSGTQGGQFIRKGTSGKEVAAVQSRLGVARTGTYTGATKRRVEKFQENHGLQVDGVVGAQTVAAMRGKTSGVEPGKLTRNDRRYLRRYASKSSV